MKSRDLYQNRIRYRQGVNVRKICAYSLNISTHFEIHSVELKTFHTGSHVYKVTVEPRYHLINMVAM